MLSSPGEAGKKEKFLKNENKISEDKLKRFPDEGKCN